MEMQLGTNHCGCQLGLKYGALVDTVHLLDMEELSKTHLTISAAAASAEKGQAPPTVLAPPKKLGGQVVTLEILGTLRGLSKY